MINMGENNNGTTNTNEVDLEKNNNLPEIIVNPDAYKVALRQMPEVQALTSEIEIQNTNSILMFGQKPSENISRVSDELLKSMKAVKAEEVSEMLVHLTKIMDKFDIQELTEPNAKPSVFSKIFKSMQNSIEKLFEKYDDMGKEVDAIYVTLKKFETDIQKSNADLKKLMDGNIEFFQQLEKYVVAGEIALEEIEDYKQQYANNDSISPEERQMMIQKLDMAKEMLSQRIYDLRIAENVALQTCPMINTMQMSNFNLMRKINSSFIITLPIFKQCLAQAVILKRQEVQAKSIKQLDDKTNELLLRNAELNATQSVNIAKMASGSSIQIETLEKTYETIKNGIEETKAIQAQARAEREQNSAKLESLKGDIKKQLH